MGRKRPRSRGIVRASKKRKLEEREEILASQFIPHEPNICFENFKQFYYEQNLLDDYEWDDFLYYLNQPLPVTFRITQNIGQKELFDQCIKSSRRLFTDEEIYDEDQVIYPPTYLDWCNSWQLGCSREYLKQSNHPKLQKIHQWILKYTSLGSIIRQETVSMLTVTFLQVEPQHKVLDLCAAPGSKTTQVLDALFANGERAVTGCVIANDLDPRRSYMLVRRCAALTSACQHLMVTCHKAQYFPDVYHDPLKGPKRRPNGAGFDRIVCDVPCCGDGTLRKTKALLRRWNPFIGIGLHSLQIQIAMRGIELLNVGGIMAYSTCTFNPLENEAVVASLLHRCNGSIELLDTSNLFPEIARRPGLRYWKVFNNDMTHFKTYEDSQAEGTPENQRICFRRSMWPPPASEIYPLQRCMRFLPHLQDTGGFFVALLRKVAPLPMNTNNSNKIPTPKVVTKYETENRYHPITNEALEVLGMCFKLSKSFKKKIVPNLFMRSKEIGTISYIADGIKNHCFEKPSSDRLKPVFSGIKVFKYNKKTETFNITQEGTWKFHEYIKKPKIEVPKEDMIKLLQNINQMVKFSDLSSKEVEKLYPGSCIIQTGDVSIAARRVKDPPALKIQLKATRGLEGMPDAFAQTLIQDLLSQ